MTVFPLQLIDYRVTPVSTKTRGAPHPDRFLVSLSMCRCSSSDASIAARKAHRAGAARLLALRCESRSGSPQSFNCNPFFVPHPEPKIRSDFTCRRHVRRRPKKSHPFCRLIREGAYAWLQNLNLTARDESQALERHDLHSLAANGKTRRLEWARIYPRLKCHVFIHLCIFGVQLTCFHRLNFLAQK